MPFAQEKTAGEADLAAIAPKVGIFFYVDAVTIMDAVSIEEGEPYGEAH